MKLDFLKHHKKEPPKDHKDLEAKHPQTDDHSLQAQAKKRAQHPEHIHAGTPFDWEDIDAYQRELDRMDREGPGRSQKKD
ncbi:hypothetical protein [Marinimicrobium sp. ABcell2]|uniref:hypothetical protein n=1 Tax=Marinimicrobium sp. ABcell2 TaxID=3069751 RepID=UPI0027B85B88|nr:hypothetical protein [Marinimicrobium sp. ABcell2]MDQ2077615.1 hypothetical protein [Marinimicrobium sp. ABcell2]